MNHIARAKDTVVDTAGNVVDSVKQVSSDAKKETAKYLLAGLALTVGLGWNEAIKGAIESRFPVKDGGIGTKFIYALALTLFLVIFSTMLAKADVKPPEKPPSCICADNEEVKKITTQLNDKIDRVIYEKGLERTGFIN